MEHAASAACPPLVRAVRSLSQDAGEPCPYRCGHGREVRSQAVVTLHQHNRATGGARRDAEWVSRALHDQGRDHHLVEFGKAAWSRRRPGTVRWLKWEREAKHCDGTGCLCRATGHPRSHRAAAGDERQPVELTCEEVVDHRRPGGVELTRRSRSAPPRNSVGLLDECDAEPLRPRDIGHGNQISRTHASGGSMTQDERGSWPIGGVQMGIRPAVRRIDFNHRHRRPLAGLARSAPLHSVAAAATTMLRLWSR